MKQNIGAVAFILGLIGAMMGVGGVEASQNTQQLITGVGTAVTSLMLMYMGTVMIKDEI